MPALVLNLAWEIAHVRLYAIWVEADALGIAGTQASGLTEWRADGSWIKRLHPGRAAHAGVLAARLAREGFTGPASIFEGDGGFFRAFTHGETIDPDAMTRDLGRDFRALGTAVKPYPCCRFEHGAVVLLDVENDGTTPFRRFENAHSCRRRHWNAPSSPRSRTAWCRGRARRTSMSIDANEESGDLVHLTVRGRLTTADQAALVQRHDQGTLREPRGEPPRSACAPPAEYGLRARVRACALSGHRDGRQR